MEQALIFDLGNKGSCLQVMACAQRPPGARGKVNLIIHPRCSGNAWIFFFRHFLYYVPLLGVLSKSVIFRFNGFSVPSLSQIQSPPPLYMFLSPSCGEVCPSPKVLALCLQSITPPAKCYLAPHSPPFLS